MWHSLTLCLVLGGILAALFSVLWVLILFLWTFLDRLAVEFGHHAVSLTIATVFVVLLVLWIMRK